MLLSVSMIVKNEEVMLPAILQDCKAFADQVVVCDTGSTDKTRQVIRDFGAELVEYPWDNSFSTARNAALVPCRGKYVMWFDADDRITPDYQERMNWLKEDHLGRKVLRAFTVNLISHGKAHLGKMSQLRIFPKLCEGMWRGRAHEAVGEALRRHSVLTVETGIWIFHEGYTDPDMLDAKVKRNIELLEMDCLETGNPIKRSYLGRSMMDLGDEQGGLEVMATIYDSEELHQSRGQSFMYFMGLHKVLWHRKEYVALWGAMERAKKTAPEDIQPWVVQAEVAYAAGKFETARDLCREALKRDYDVDCVPMVDNAKVRAAEMLKELNSVVAIMKGEAGKTDPKLPEEEQRIADFLKKSREVRGSTGEARNTEKKGG